jgi:hypothetical protein
MDDALRPEGPLDALVEPEVADATREEGARVLADEARDLLRPRGFSDQQIREWAETYVAECGSGDVDGLLEFIADREARSR